MYTIYTFVSSFNTVTPVKVLTHGLTDIPSKCNLATCLFNHLNEQIRVHNRHKIK